MREIACQHCHYGCFQPCPNRSSVRAAPSLSPGGELWPSWGWQQQLWGYRRLLCKLDGALSGTGGFLCGRGWDSFFKGNVFYCKLEVRSIFLFYMIIVILMNFSVRYKKTYRDQNIDGRLGWRFWGSFYFFPAIRISIIKWNPALSCLLCNAELYHQVIENSRLHIWLGYKLIPL